jgi:hypothetical protein
MPVTTLPVTDMLPTKWEPLFKHRFLFAIEGIDSFLVKSADRPKYTIEEKPIPWINSTRYVAGKTTFETLAVVLYEAIAPSGAQQVMEWIRLHFESVSGRGGYADFYKRDIQLKMLDPVGNVVQLWDIKGAQLTKAEFSGGDYGTADMSEITLNIRFDNCVLQF